MDILYLLDRLEETLTSGPHVPFSSRSLVDEQEALEILDQIRVAIPEELKQARRLLAERESIVEHANDEAVRLSMQLEAQMEERLNDHTLVRQAESRAQEIQQEALESVRKMRLDVDEYSYRVLARVQNQLRKLLDQVEQGMESLGAEVQEEHAAVTDEAWERRPN